DAPEAASHFGIGAEDLLNRLRELLTGIAFTELQLLVISRGSLRQQRDHDYETRENADPAHRTATPILAPVFRGADGFPQTHRVQSQRCGPPSAGICVPEPWNLVIEPSSWVS